MLQYTLSHLIIISVSWSCIEVFQISFMQVKEQSDKNLLTWFVTLTFDLHAYFKHSVHWLLVMIINAKAFQNTSMHVGVMEQTPFCDLTLTVTLTFDQHTWMLHSAQCSLWWQFVPKYFKINPCTIMWLDLGDLDLWPWPLTHMPNLYNLRIFFLWWSFVRKYLKIHLWM